MATSKAKQKPSDSEAHDLRPGQPRPEEGGGSVPFEQAMRRLGEIVTELEGGELSLEESLARFEEGVRLASVSQKQLDEAEARVEELLDVTDDGPVTREFEE